MEDYKIELKEYERLQKSINCLSCIIEESMAQPPIPLLRKIEDSHPYHQLQTLRSHLRPLHHTVEIPLLLQLTQLTKPPATQSLDN